MNTPDLYGAWLTAGDRLQPVGAWIGGHGPYLTAAVGGALGWWVMPRISRIRTRVAARRGIRHLESFANHPANRTRKGDTRG